jgi:hypothetical protein
MVLGTYTEGSNKRYVKIVSTGNRPYIAETVQPQTPGSIMREYTDTRTNELKTTTEMVYGYVQGKVESIKVNEKENFSQLQVNFAPDVDGAISLQVDLNSPYAEELMNVAPNIIGQIVYLVPYKSEDKKGYMRNHLSIKFNGRDGEHPLPYFHGWDKKLGKERYNGNVPGLVEWTTNNVPNQATAQSEDWKYYFTKLKRIQIDHLKAMLPTWNGEQAVASAPVATPVAPEPVYAEPIQQQAPVYTEPQAPVQSAPVYDEFGGMQQQAQPVVQGRPMDISDDDLPF